MRVKVYLGIGFISAVIAAYMLVPGCGNKDNNNNVPPPTTCLPGQLCSAGGVPGGIPLIPSPSYSVLDSTASTVLILNYGAPSVTAGTVYNGPVNISGVLRLGAGACGPSSPPGEFPVSGQGTWYGGYAGAVASVSGTLTIAGGPGGTLYIYPALIRNVPSGPYPYSLSEGYGVAVPACGRIFAFYN